MKNRSHSFRAAIAAAAAIGALATWPAFAQDRQVIRWGSPPSNSGSTANRPTPAPSKPTTVYVNATRVVIRSGMSPTSPAVAEVTKGTALRVLEDAGQRLKVEAPGGKVGYIVKLNTSSTKPKQDNAGFSDLLRSSGGAGESSSGGSVRGLKPVINPNGPQPVTVQAQKTRELALSITREQVAEFMKAGGVTPP